MFIELKHGFCLNILFGQVIELRGRFIAGDIKQPILGADVPIHYSLLVDLKGRCLRDMRTGLAIQATILSIKPFSLNRIDSIRNKNTELLDQFPELTRPMTKGETVKHGITHKI